MSKLNFKKLWNWKLDPLARLKILLFIFPFIIGNFVLSIIFMLLDWGAGRILTSFIWVLIQGVLGWMLYNANVNKIMEEDPELAKSLGVNEGEKDEI